MNRPRSETADQRPPAARLDSQLADLIEVVWACEVAPRRYDRIHAAIGYEHG